MKSAEDLPYSTINIPTLVVDDTHVELDLAADFAARVDLTPPLGRPGVENLKSRRQAWRRNREAEAEVY